MDQETRNNMIESIADYMIDRTVDNSILYDIFVEGFKGYENYSDVELEQEFKDIFGS